MYSQIIIQKIAWRDMFRNMVHPVETEIINGDHFQELIYGSVLYSSLSMVFHAWI